MDEQIIYKKYLDSALRFLSFRPRSESEMREKLIDKKAPIDIIEKIITWLKEQKFIDDKEFTRWWIEQRTVFRPKGKRLIVIELKQKGIDNAVIEEGFINASTQGQAQLGMIKDKPLRNESEVVKQIVEKKLPKYAGLPKREIYQKLGAHLSRRGFDWDTIKKAIDDVIS